MKKIILAFVFIAVAIINFTACSKDSDVPEMASPNAPNPPENVANMKIKIRIGSTEFSATLENNSSAMAFRNLLPLTINMAEMNGNEKYASLSQALPTNIANTRLIENGDIMLFGSSTLVLFYKSFSTSYNYSRVGKVDDPALLQSVFGASDVNLVFENIE